MNEYLKNLFNDTMDTYDKWGSALMFTFALCDIIADLDGDICKDLEFHQSICGSDTDSEIYQTIKELLENNDIILKDCEESTTILNRYLDLLKHNNLDY